MNAKYEPYDVMRVTDDEWERCVHFATLSLSLSVPWTYFAIAICRIKVSGEQFEDRIVEVHWDPAVEGWRMMRFRDDKPAGNHISTVEKVIKSIRDGVEKEAVRITQHLRSDRFFNRLTSPSCSRNAGPSGRPGKPDKTNRTNHSSLPTSARDHPTSLPLSPNKDLYHLLILNLHTQTPIPTYGYGNHHRTSSNIPSRTLRRECKVVLCRCNRR